MGRTIRVDQLVRVEKLGFDVGLVARRSHASSSTAGARLPLSTSPPSSYTIHFAQASCQHIAACIMFRAQSSPMDDAIGKCLDIDSGVLRKVASEED